MIAALHPDPRPGSAVTRDGFRSTGPGFVGDRGNRANNLVVRLANEGLPILPIARVAQLPVDIVQRAIDRAIAQRILAFQPPLDWPDGAPTRPAALDRDAEIIARSTPLVPSVMAMFDPCPRQEARLIALLICEGAVARTALGRMLVLRQGDPRKTINVVASHVRTKLATRGIELQTLYGQGYALQDADRERLLRSATAGSSESVVRASGDFLAALATERRDDRPVGAC